MSDDNTFLSAADEIGARLCADAIRHDGRCTWLGDRQGSRSGGGRRFDTVSLDGSFYSGSAGVGWFLAELARESGEAIHARTAKAALRQCRHQAAQEQNSGASLYSGLAGVAWAFRRVGEALGEEEFIAASVGLLKDCRESSRDGGNPDVIAGAAGGGLSCWNWLLR